MYAQGMPTMKNGQKYRCPHSWSTIFPIKVFHTETMFIKFLYQKMPLLV